MITTTLFVLTPDWPESEGFYPPQGEYAEVIAKAKAYGYDGVEIDMGDVDLFDAEAFKLELEKQQMTVSAINSGGLHYLFDSTLVNADPEKEAFAREKMLKMAQACKTLGCLLQCGIARGEMLRDKPYWYYKERLVENLKPIVAFAADLGVTMALEYTNRLEANAINTCAEALDIIRRVDHPNLGLLIDTYHSYLEDLDVYQNILDARDYVKHFHLHDSDRGPACASNGVLDFDRILAILKEIEFSGSLSDGLLTTQLPEEQVKRSTATVKQKLAQYGLV